MTQYVIPTKDGNIRFFDDWGKSPIENAKKHAIKNKRAGLLKPNGEYILFYKYQNVLWKKIYQCIKPI